MENKDFIEEEVLVSIAGYEEVPYHMVCYDGYANGSLKYDLDDENYPNAPLLIHMEYPKLADILADETQAKEVLAYRGLCDLKPSDIHYGDIMMCYGVIK